MDEPVFGSRVHLWEAGPDGAYTVVLVHGLGDDASQVWDALVPALSKRYRVVGFDLPGLGRSSKPDALYSPTAYARFVAWVVGRRVPDRFALVGHSLGGAVALRYAATAPERLDRLLLVDVAGVLHRRVLTNEALSPDLSGRAGSLLQPVAGTVEGWIRSAVANLPNASLDLGAVLSTPFLRQKLLGGSPAKIAGLALAEEDFTAALGQVRAPTLVLWGSRDPVAPLRTGKLLAGSLPGARLRVLDGLGHEPMREQPQLFETAVLEWLAAGPGEARPPPTPPLTDRVGTCRGAAGMVFTGGYDRLEIQGCTDVRLEGVTARRIDIAGSSVEMEACTVRGGEEGLVVRDSVLTATDVRVEAADALVVAGGRLDLAGVELVSERCAVRAEVPTTVLFSVSRARSSHTKGTLHGPVEVTPEKPL